MAESEPLDLAGKPRLPRGVRLKHDEQRGEWILLAPERLLKLNAVSVEILKRCTGEATVEAIVADTCRFLRQPGQPAAVPAGHGG